MHYSISVLELETDHRSDKVYTNIILPRNDSALQKQNCSNFVLEITRFFILCISPEWLTLPLLTCGFSYLIFPQIR